MEIRDELFGDHPLEYWGSHNIEAEPWSLFATARSQVAAGQLGDAVQTLQSVITLPNLESRHYLQAWHCLRNLGVIPSADIATEILGVVVEVGLEAGVDLVAAYADGAARYFNAQGGGIIWEAQNSKNHPVIAQDIHVLLQIAAAVIQYIGPLEGPRPHPPTNGYARINLLTPIGLHCGEGPYDVLAADELGRPLISSAFKLMTDLIELSRSQHQP